MTIGISSKDEIKSKGFWLLDITLEINSITINDLIISSLDICIIKIRLIVYDKSIKSNGLDIYITKTKLIVDNNDI